MNRRKALQMITHRREHLARRIDAREASGKPTDWDRAEVSAIDWVLEALGDRGDKGQPVETTVEAHGGPEDRGVL